MDLQKLQRALDHLAVLWAIRADPDRKREDELRTILVALLLGAWSDRDWDNFKTEMLAALAAAFSELDPNDEYEELIRKELATQSGYSSGFVNALRNGTLSEAEAKNRAGMYATSLGKLKWQITLTDSGDAEMAWKYNESVLDHCPDCIELNGVVRKASTWLATIYPRSGKTLCKMFCQCDLVPV